MLERSMAKIAASLGSDVCPKVLKEELAGFDVSMKSQVLWDMLDNFTLSPL